MDRTRRMTTHGFTLLELLMVVIIIGILAAIALPQYLKTTERGRMSEALSYLGEIRSSELRYFAEYATYVSLATGIPTSLDVGALTGTPFFAYTVPTGGASLSVRAVRNTVSWSTVSGCTSSYRVCITDAGVIAGNDCQSTAC